MRVNPIDCFELPIRRPGGLMTYWIKRVNGKAQNITRAEYQRIRNLRGVVDLTPNAQ